MARESKGSGDIGFRVLDSRTSGLHVCSRDVSIYGMGLKMAAVEAVFEESLCQALSGINLENVSLRVEQKEAIRNIAVWLGENEPFIVVKPPFKCLLI